MAKIDSVGTYRGSIKEAAFSLTRNGFPQFVLKLDATERYIESKSDLAYYVEQGVITDETPQWINWENLEEDIVSYMTLYGNKDGTGEFTPANATLAIQQLQTALGWDGASFGPLHDGTYVGSQVLFRVAENNNPEFTNLRVAWLDKFDAPPTRTLSGIQSSELAGLDAKLARGGGKKKAVVAAPKAAAPKAAAPKPPVASTPTATPPVAKAPVAAKPATSTVSARDAAYAAVVAASTESEADNNSAWTDSVNEIMQDNDFNDEAQLTDDHWVKVQNLTLRDLGISPASV
jgi:hypothetical protein